MRAPTLGLSLVLAAAALAATGCGLFHSASKVADTYAEVARSGEPGDPVHEAAYDVPAPQPRPGFSAGAAAEDITPPPGFPTGGHGPAGDVARGRWARLRARAFFFEDRGGRTLALVSADLFAVPAGLHAAVARRAAAELAARKVDVALPPEALVLAATHTHHGPGNFLSSRIYNQFGSSYPGYSQELLDFLAGRIAAAVVAAAADARAHPGAAALAVHQGRVGYDTVRNRSPWSFTLNQDREALLAALNGGDPAPACRPAPEEPQELWDLRGCPRLRAADRDLTVLEVVRDEGGRRTTAAALVFFAAHPTVLPAPTPFYSPDFMGYAMLALEARLAGQGKPVVGFFNGAEGDVTVRHRRRDLREAARFGEAFADRVEDALRAAPQRTLQDPAVAVRSRAWRFAAAGERACGDAAAGARLAPAPKMGAAALGGAETDRTPLFALGWRDGVRDRAVDDQGVKLPALDSRIIRGLAFSEDFAPPDAYPPALPLTLASLGDLVLAAVPLELTTAQGQAVRKELGLPHGRLELVGLADEYASYCSTSDEYAAQDYMGASTIWGPGEGQFVACRLGELSRAPEATTRHVAEREFWPGNPPRERFGRDFTATLRRPDEGLEQVLRDRDGLPERKLPWFAWEEAPPGPEFEQAKAQRVAIRKAEGGAWREVEDDAGAGFLTVYLGGNRWGAIWLAPVLADGARGRYSFAVTAGGQARCSQPFDVAPGQPGPDRVADAACDAPP